MKVLVMLSCGGDFYGEFVDCAEVEVCLLVPDDSSRESLMEQWRTETWKHGVWRGRPTKYPSQTIDFEVWAKAKFPVVDCINITR